MTFEEWMEKKTDVIPLTIADRFLAKEAWLAATDAERERIKSRVKEAAENLWCIRNQVGEEPYSIYIGPSISTLEEIVNRLLEGT